MNIFSVVGVLEDLSFILALIQVVFFITIPILIIILLIKTIKKRNLEIEMLKTQRTYQLQEIQNNMNFKE